MEKIVLKDVFGMVLDAHYQGRRSVHIIERDDGREEDMDTSGYFAPYEEWPFVERAAIMEAWGRVLDVGCGAGRVALWLQDRGLEVVGIDLSPLAVEVSKRRGVKDCRLMDARELDFPEGSINSVVMYGNNFGIGGDVSGTRKLLRSLYRMTSPEGIIIASIRGPLNTENPAHLAYHEMNRRRGKPPGLVKLRVGFEGEFDPWFDLLMVGKERLIEVVEFTGWEIARYYEDKGALYVAILSKMRRK